MDGADVLYGTSFSTLDGNMPHGSFKDFEGADIAHPDPILIAEICPTWSDHLAAILVVTNRRQPRLAATCGGFESDRAKILESNGLAEGRWQTLQE